MATSYEVQGLKELEKALLDLGAETGIKTLRSAGRKAMEQVQISAAIGAGRDSGELVESIAISTRKGKRGNRAVDIDVGPTKTSVTDKAADGSKSKRKLNNVNQKAIAQEFGTVKQKADPFLRPALELNADRVLNTFKTELARAIQKAARKAAQAAK